jgi:hypothetical protein
MLERYTGDLKGVPYLVTLGVGIVRTFNRRAVHESIRLLDPR